MAKQEGGVDKGGTKEQTDAGRINSDSSKSSLAPKAEEISRATSPKHDLTERRSSGQASLGIGNPTPCKY